MMYKKLIAVFLILCMLPIIPVFAETVTSQRISTSDSGFLTYGSWANASMADSTGSTTSGVSKYSGTVGNYAQYTPTNLQPGWYDISFWNIKYQTNQNPMKMEGAVYSNGVLTEHIPLEVSTATVDRTGAWTKVGTYYFSGTNDEYFRLVVAVAGAQSRVADVKFELNEDYVLPKATYQLITTFDKGFSKEGKNWAEGTMANSLGSTTKGASLYSATVGDYVQYTPENLEPGWYDISFWNIKYQTNQDPMKMTGTVYSNGKTTSGIKLGVSTATVDRTGAWTKVGTYYFAGTDNEYFRMTVVENKQFGRPSDVKFELNESYVPPKDTYQRIGTSDAGFSKVGTTWLEATMADSTGSTTKGVSLYSSAKGEYVQYQPSNLEAGWYDVSFWNIKYQDNQNPVKMTGTIYANGITKSEIALEVSTATEDRKGAWTKIGTYYFAGTDDEYLRLVVTGGSFARPADAKFEKNNSYTPPPSFSDKEISVSGTDKFFAYSTKGVYNVYINKNGGATDGRIDLLTDGVVIDSRYTNYEEKGKQFLGTYAFDKDSEVELLYTALDGVSVCPINAVYFAPASKENAVYSLRNMQTEKDVHFISAGMHRVCATVTNNTGEDKDYRLIATVSDTADFVSRPYGEIIKMTAMTKAVYGNTVTVKNGESVVLTADVPIEKVDSDTKLKVLIWNSLETMKPAFPAKEYQVEDTRIFGSVTITPDTFDSLGSWKKSGNTSAYTQNVLLGAAGQNIATSPATVSLNMAKGTYRVWVRSVNYQDRPEARYFNVNVNGKSLDKTFGQIGTDGLHWEDGGTVELDGETLIEAVDSSKFYAKFNLILITDDLEYQPPESYDQMLVKAPVLDKIATNMAEDEMMADFVMNKNFPGGNYIFNKKGKNVVHISPDLSDTGRSGWFYWNFKATSGSDRTVTFKITGCEQVIGSSGVVYSKDDGNTWSYITESAQKTEFTYDFKADETVQFAVTIPYQYADLTSYLGTLNSDRTEVSVLCKSEDGRDVPLVTIGNTSAPKAVVFTSRHHCCETTPSYHLEGIMDYLSYDAPDSLFEDYCFYIVPMMDVDGVENGDQGKDRTPHDHNRDYEKGLYSSVRALKELASTLDVEFFLDLHCPMLQASKPYLYYSDEDADVIAEFSRILATATESSEYENPIIFDGSRDYDSGAHFAACSRGYFFLKVGAPFSTTLEFPYSGVVGDEYTVERIYNFGIDVIKAVETYITK